MYKFARFENESIKRYEFESIEDAQKWVDQNIEEFKLVNSVRNENTDKSFIRFKTQMQETLDKQIDDYSQCKKCPQSEHEGIFCRCESRNIRIAKERRARGESPWNQNCNHCKENTKSINDDLCESCRSFERFNQLEGINS